MIKTIGLGKCFKKNCVLKNITINIENDLTVIYGKNGSGKTTFMEVLVGIQKPTQGEVEIIGPVSYMSQEPMLYDEFKVKDYALLVKSICGNREMYRDLIKRLHISPNATIHTLSYGTKKSVFLAMVLSTDSENYILDEPFLGIDAQRRSVFREIIEEKSKNSTVLMTESETVLSPRYILKGGILYEPEN